MEKGKMSGAAVRQILQVKIDNKKSLMKSKYVRIRGIEESRGKAGQNGGRQLLVKF